MNSAFSSFITVYAKRIAELVDKTVTCATKEVKKLHPEYFIDGTLQKEISKDIAVKGTRMAHPKEVSRFKDFLKLNRGGRLLISS